MAPTPLSVVIITFNEEANIARCLESVKGVADEIVVLDSGSTDGTRGIAESMGAKVFVHAFDGHIEQKNRAISHASHPFILSLDADEALDDRLRHSILKAKANREADGYTMNRLNRYCGKWLRHSGWYPDRKLRLWDSRKGKWTGVNPHDRFKMENGARVLHLEGDILHHSITDLSAHLRQVNYFTTISAEAYHRAGKRSGILKMLLSAKIKFIRDYIFRLGFMDGAAGLQVCLVSAFATYLKYAKLRELQKRK